MHLMLFSNTKEHKYQEQGSSSFTNMKNVFVDDVSQKTNWKTWLNAET